MLTGLHVGCPRYCGSIPSRGKKFISSAKYPEHHWSPPNLLLSYYWDVSQWLKVKNIYMYICILNL
jgi:hypothetical protein